MADIDNLSLRDMDKLKGMPKSNVPFDPAWKGSQRRWKAHRSGDLYVLQVVNRTTGHKFQVHQYGKNAWQASLRYYRGFQGHGKRKRDAWVWLCTKVVSAKLLTTK